MLLSALMATLGAPDPAFTGVVTNDDNILAIDISEAQDAKVGAFAVVQAAIEGVDAQMNAVSSDKQYIRAGASTTKTGTQRTFKATGDRHIGDDFQDYAFDIARLYGVGEKVVARYVWFSALTGKGEMGKAAIMVNSDGGGSAGETAAIDVELRKTGDVPVAFTWSAEA